MKFHVVTAAIGVLTGGVVQTYIVITTSRLFRGLARSWRQSPNEVATRLVEVALTKAKALCRGHTGAITKGVVSELVQTALTRAREDNLTSALTQADDDLQTVALTQADPQLLATALQEAELAILAVALT